jgi:hypothetical protein
MQSTHDLIKAKFPIGTRVKAYYMGDGIVIGYTSAYPISSYLPDVLQHRVVVRLDNPVEGKAGTPYKDTVVMRDVILAVSLLEPLEAPAMPEPEATLATLASQKYEEMAKKHLQAALPQDAAFAASYDPKAYDTFNFKEHTKDNAPTGFNLALGLMCNAEPGKPHPFFSCTLEKGHKGTHAAHGLGHIIATWDSLIDLVNDAQKTLEEDSSL